MSTNTPNDDVDFWTNHVKPEAFFSPSITPVWRQNTSAAEILGSRLKGNLPYYVAEKDTKAFIKMANDLPASEWQSQDIAKPFFVEVQGEPQKAKGKSIPLYYHQKTQHWVIHPPMQPWSKEEQITLLGYAMGNRTLGLILALEKQGWPVEELLIEKTQRYPEGVFIHAMSMQKQNHSTPIFKALAFRWSLERYPKLTERMLASSTPWLLLLDGTAPWSIVYGKHPERWAQEVETNAELLKKNLKAGKIQDEETTKRLMEVLYDSKKVKKASETSTKRLSKAGALKEAAPPADSKTETTLNEDALTMRFAAAFAWGLIAKPDGKPIEGSSHLRALLHSFGLDKPWTVDSIIPSNVRTFWEETIKGWKSLPPKKQMDVIKAAFSVKGLGFEALGKSLSSYSHYETVANLFAELWEDYDWGKTNLTSYEQSKMIAATVFLPMRLCMDDFSPRRSKERSAFPFNEYLLNAAQKAIKPALDDPQWWEHLREECGRPRGTALTRHPKEVLLWLAIDHIYSHHKDAPAHPLWNELYQTLRCVLSTGDAISNEFKGHRFIWTERDHKQLKESLNCSSWTPEMARMAACLFMQTFLCSAAGSASPPL